MYTANSTRPSRSLIETVASFMMIKIMVYVISIGGALLLSLVAYGFYLPETRTVTCSAFINARTEKVYDIAISAKSQTLWRRDVLAVTMGSDGRSWIEHTQKGDIHFVLTNQNRPLSFSLSHEGPGFRGEWTGKFMPKGSGMELWISEVITIKNPVLKILSRVFKLTENFVADYMRNLKAAAEKET